MFVVIPKVDLLSNGLDLLDLFLCQQIRLETRHLDELGHARLVRRRRDGDDAFLFGPEQEHGGSVDFLTGRFGKTGRDAGEDDFEWPLAVTKDGGEGSVGFDSDVVLLANGEDGSEVAQNIRVVLEFCKTNDLIYINQSMTARRKKKPPL